MSVRNYSHPEFITNVPRKVADSKTFLGLATLFGLTMATNFGIAQIASYAIGTCFAAKTAMLLGTGIPCLMIGTVGAAGLVRLHLREKAEKKRIEAAKTEAY